MAALRTPTGSLQSQKPSPPSHLLSSIYYLLPLAWLWFRLIDHLRVEWSVNPQYTYGWAVPFLCAYLLWRKANSRKQREEIGHQKTVVSGLAVRLSLAFCALLYLPTRMIQEADPEWRLVSWALAIEVIGLTLLLLRLFAEGRDQRPEFSGQWSAVSGQWQALAFPICFFLVAVPWPTIVEGPLIQGLMRANIGVTIELLSVIGIPAVQHSNVIEIATGMIGIDDACSGIRSFQAALMLSLFFGEIYALSFRRRALCVFAGLALAFAFNVGRTLLLTQVASAKGVGAVATWHDPAGVTILVGCFLSLWLIARASQRADSRQQAAELETAGPGGQRVLVPSTFNDQPSTLDPQVSTLNPQPALPTSLFHLRWVSVALLAWLLMVEAGTELWYRSHEWRIPHTLGWYVEFPRSNPTFRVLPFSDKTKQFLRYDEGFNGTWQQGNEQRWQAIFFRWNPGRIAVHLAKSHTPEVCLTAAGRELVSQSGLRPVLAHGLQLPFLSYVVKDEAGPLHVFYCLWEDRADAQSFRTTTMTYANRLAPVLAGRRNSGQRSLEVAIWGIADQQEAEAALARELDKLIKVVR
jgi:exosortase/archaeosortase family protein